MIAAARVSLTAATTGLAGANDAEVVGLPWSARLNAETHPGPVLVVGEGPGPVRGREKLEFAQACVRLLAWQNRFRSVNHMLQKVNHMLQLEQLPDRLNPGALNPADWQLGTFESLGYVGTGTNGALVAGDLSFVEADWNRDGLIDLVVVGSAPGNGPVATVIDSVDGRSTDDPYATGPITGRVLERFSVQGFDENTHRTGLDVSAFKTQSPSLSGPGWMLLFRPLGTKDGPVVTSCAVGDSSSQRPAFVFSGEYRGTFDMRTVDTDGDGRDEIIALPGAGGGPRLVVIDTATMTERKSFYVGPENDRSGRYTIVPATEGVQMRPPEPTRGLMIDSPDGTPRLWGFDGIEYRNARDDDPPDQQAGGWRLAR